MHEMVCQDESSILYFGMRRTSADPASSGSSQLTSSSAPLSPWHTSVIEEHQRNADWPSGYSAHEPLYAPCFLFTGPAAEWRKTLVVFDCCYQGGGAICKRPPPRRRWLGVLKKSDQKKNDFSSVGLLQVKFLLPNPQPTHGWSITASQVKDCWTCTGVSEELKVSKSIGF